MPIITGPIIIPAENIQGTQPGITAATCGVTCETIAPYALYNDASTECITACLHTPPSQFNYNYFWNEVFGEERAYNLYNIITNPNGQVPQLLAIYDKQRKTIIVSIAVVMLIIILAILFL